MIIKLKNCLAVLGPILVASHIVSPVSEVPPPIHSSIVSRDGTYTNPVNARDGADPWMRYIDGKFFLSTTNKENIQVKSAATLEGLKTATASIVYNGTVAERNSGFWAPEFWFLDGRWYLYYTVAGDDDNDIRHIHVAEGGTNVNDPLNGTYKHVKALIPSNFEFQAIDGSILQRDQETFLLFSGTTEGNIQCLYIVPMSGATTLSGSAVQISCPVHPWEQDHGLINEGPEAITIGNVSHIVFSASHCETDNYALGMLTLSKGASPLNSTSWTKSTDPVFTRNNAAQVYGPGHHFMFQKDAQWLFAYHANPAPSQGCGSNRTTRVQQFTIVNGTTPKFPSAVATEVPLPEP